jgi:hypothetical protein
MRVAWLAAADQAGLENGDAPDRAPSHRLNERADAGRGIEVRFRLGADESVIGLSNRQPKDGRAFRRRSAAHSGTTLDRTVEPIVHIGFRQRIV